MPTQKWTPDEIASSDVLIDSAIPMISGDYNYLVLRVHWETVGADKVVIIGYLMGIEFAKDTISAGHTTAHFHHESPLSKVDLNIRLEHGHDLWIDGEVCMRTWKWNCKNFKAFLVHM
jgi:hypothetical protein